MKIKYSLIVLVMISLMVFVACDETDDATMNNDKDVIVSSETSNSDSSIETSEDKSKTEAKEDESKTEAIKDESQTEVKDEPVKEENNSTTKNNTTIEESEVKESSQTKGQLEFIQIIDTHPKVPEYNEEKVNEAISKGFESPMDQLEIYRYAPLSGDTIQYMSQNSSFELGESLSHNGFDNLEITYEKVKYTWNDFFGDIDVTEYPRNITVSLKGNNIHEADIVDEYEKYYRYYDENKGLYYEVQDLMMGNFTDGSELTNKKIGMVCNYGANDVLVKPSYDPFVLEEEEIATNYYVTSLDGKPTLYFETSVKDKLHKKWVDIKYGVLVKELVFDSEGMLVERKIATSVSEKAIDQSLFSEPKEVEYKDITMLIYSLSGGAAESLYKAVFSVVTENNGGIKLTSDSGSEIILYHTGLDEGMMGELSPDDAVYVSYHTNSSGETSRIRAFENDRYYTIHDGLKKVEIYDVSAREKKFFDFNKVGLLSVKEGNGILKYSFYDPNNISVSALYSVYEYVVADDQLVEINYYYIENITEKEPVNNITTYKIETIDFDESVYDESFVDSYETIDRGEGSFDDGEHMPFWYE